MQSSKSDLLARLRDLHEEFELLNENLKEGEHLDDETVNALGQLVNDVGTLVDRRNPVPEEDEPPIEEHHDLLDRIMQFETEHPQAVRFLSQVTDMLAMMGI